MMGMRVRVVGAVTALVVGCATPGYAQMSNKAAPVVVGHFHLNVTSLDAHKKFWADTLGGTATKLYGIDVIQFPDIYIFLRQQTPTGPTRGTAFDHVGLAVPDVPAATTKVVAAGYTLTSGREPVPGKEEAAATGTQAPYGRFSYLVGPDGVKVELVTAAGPNAPPVAYHHIHFINKQCLKIINSKPGRNCLPLTGKLFFQCLQVYIMMPAMTIAPLCLNITNCQISG
jgi:predicted enzyme related to lactoylglutathione lyase